ncbi:MAG: hypothetical protein ACFFCZ_27450 [Promethearchaeota archaeon]
MKYRINQKIDKKWIILLLTLNILFTGFQIPLNSTIFIFGSVKVEYLDLFPSQQDYENLLIAHQKSDLVSEKNVLNSDFYSSLITFRQSESYIEHTAISINGNSDFLSQATNEGWNGTGTIDDPIIIAGYKFSNDSGYLFKIENTNLHFDLRDNLFDGENITREVGLHFGNVSLGTISNNFIFDLRGADDENITGCYVVDGNHLTFTDNTLGRITGNNGKVIYYDPRYYYSLGGEAIGVHVVNTTNLILRNNSFYNIEGGEGASHEYGGDGGTGIGIYLEGIINLTFTNNSFRRIIGGDGGSAGGGGGSYGGSAIGILLKNGTNGKFENNILSVIISGKKGVGRTPGGSPGICQGLSFINVRNMLVNGTTLSDTNGIAIDLKTVNNLLITNNNISNNIGRSGHTERVGGTHGESVVGIRLVDAFNNTFIDNSVINTRGGQGGSSTSSMSGSPGDGGNATGFHLNHAENNTLNNNTVNNTLGGDGGDARTGENGGQGGDGIGFLLESSNTNTICNNIILNTIGGQGGSGESNGIDGIGETILLIDSADNTLCNNTSSININENGFGNALFILAFLFSVFTAIVAGIGLAKIVKKRKYVL